MPFAFEKFTQWKLGGKKKREGEKEGSAPYPDKEARFQ